MKRELSVVPATMTSLPVGVKTMPFAKPMCLADVVNLSELVKSTKVTHDKGRDPKVSTLFNMLRKRGMKRWSFVTKKDV